MDESIEQRVMHKVQRSEIQSARQALLVKYLSPDIDVKIRQRTFIKELMAEIKALRDLGVGFDEIAETLREFGCKLSGESLRTYYYEEKREQNEEELQEVVKRYRDAAESAAQAFELSVGRDLGSLVKEALDGATSRQKTKAKSPPPVREPKKIKEPPAAADAISVRRDSEGGGNHESRGRIEQLLLDHASSDGDVSIASVPSSPKLTDVTAIMNAKIDLSDIPDRDKPTD